MPSKNKDQNNKYQREWYNRNKSKKKELVLARERELIEWLKSYKSNLCCEECGENHPACLDFHHLDPLKKTIDISLAVSKMGWGKERILEEMAKCKVLCSNCHRKLHWEERYAGVAERLRQTA